MDALSVGRRYLEAEVNWRSASLIRRLAILIGGEPKIGFHMGRRFDIRRWKGRDYLVKIEEEG